MAATQGLRLYNTLTRAKEEFSPIDPANVRMYVCGPTVYDYAHIGNARPAIVFDVLFRLLRHTYGESHVTYVRNITDVDDKINARALRDFGAEIDAGRLTLNQAIRKVTETTYEQYQKDVKALGCLDPTHQPRATEFVQPRPDGRADMTSLIQKLIDRGNAYEASGEVLFDTASMPDYGRLSRRNLDEQQAGARVEVEAHKKSPGDFVLWKASSPEEPGWTSPWGRGRPGWHIECSAMSAAYLGEVFDIHGGGLDLIFPHHENEIAQSRCAHGTDVMANVWMHNGFLQVEGRKMSKSDGNFVTIHELLETEKFGGRKWPGEVLRLAMLMTHYRQPIDWTVDGLRQAEKDYFDLRDTAAEFSPTEVDKDALIAITNDLNTHEVIARLYQLRKIANDGDYDAGGRLAATFSMLGLGENLDRGAISLEPPSAPDSILAQVFGTRTEADVFRDWMSLVPKNDRISRLLGAVERTRWAFDIEAQKEILMTYLQHASLEVRAGEAAELAGQIPQINRQLADRLAFIAAKNWAEADRIRDELLAEGIQLKDGKDPATGERVTTWEVKR